MHGGYGGKWMAVAGEGGTRVDEVRENGSHGQGKPGEKNGR